MLQLSALQSEDFVHRFDSVGRAQATEIFASPTAERLADAAEKAPFKLSVNSGPKSMDLDLDELAGLTPLQQEQMQTLIYSGAHSGFQYCFDSYRLSDEVDSGALKQGPLFDFHQAINSEAALEAFRRLAGDERISFCDAQVTRYRPGHFLSMHDDDVAAKNRVMAYVVNLTRHWRPDWGGLLLFHGQGGLVEGGFSPLFNVMNLFKVPQQHSVSLTAPFAGSDRLSITGWVRRA
ncbi:2OG-Fe(II) oxygenase [Paucibacter sp. XJ19-41]|uniref:2OG-Fe(II) oxygenase n=1 Tax=Paucibacter sp. XJ19-41 TaxID=2927824 RepID=UPI0023492786|nr:2OG-Fe(II) oxygenase family protein [Paucibacter sp. XJ19-41]MDC6170538.1 2OG-Fe(II) oxygenase family protein [Paucibacter sp. XJ19-41]